MLPRTMKEIRFAFGLNTKGDDRAQPEQLLDQAVNVEFDDIGGLRCRFPFDTVRTNILGGGTITNARRLVLNGDELLLFTDVALYSWSSRDAAWVLKGTHLAVASDEVNVSTVSNDQNNCDRAELNSTVMTTWEAPSATGIYISARDKATGASLVAPSFIALGVSPRLVALDTKILLLYLDNSGPPNLMGLVFDPANVAAGIVAATTVHATAVKYDAVKVPGSDTALIVTSVNGAASYEVIKATSALALTKVNKARTCNGPIAVSIDPAVAIAQVVRTNGANIVGDALTYSTLADASINQGIGTAPTTPVNNIAACFRSVQNGGTYRCYCFWTSGQSTAINVDWRSQTNWVATNFTLGTQADFVRLMGIASRAFDYNGQIYVWGVFAGATFSASVINLYRQQLQNAYFLYRDDALLVGEACQDRGGGFSTNAALPGVQLTLGSTTYTWGATVRRKVPIASGVTGSFGYSERAPCDVTFTFDDNRARRCAQLGSTIYVAGALPLQYDGAGLYELGFLQYPWAFNSTQAAGGSIALGAYAWKKTWRWQNARGETERSTTAAVISGSITGGNSAIQITDAPLCITRKTGITSETWRTQISPVATSPFYLVSNQDPSQTSNPNRYVANDPTTFPLAMIQDDFADASITLLEQNLENNSVLPNLRPPPASIIFATDTRIFLAGVAGDPNRVWYSKQRNTGEVAAFSDTLQFDVPAEGGAITGIDFLDGSLVVWRETATYLFAGNGFDNTGGGTNYQLARILSSDLGCVSQEAHVYFDDGMLTKTNKGWFLLDRSLNYTYVGEGPARYDAETVSAMTVLTARHQIRILTDQRMLVFDTLVKQWAQFTVDDGLDLTIWNGSPAYLTSTGVRSEFTGWSGYGGQDYTLTYFELETGWIKFGSMQSRAIVDFVQLLGEFRSPCSIRKRLAKDYEAVDEDTWNYTTDETWTPDPSTAVGTGMQVRQGPRRKRCESVKARFTVTNVSVGSALTGPCARLTSIAIPFAVEPNAYGAISATAKQ